MRAIAVVVFVCLCITARAADTELAGLISRAQRLADDWRLAEAERLLLEALRVANSGSSVAERATVLNNLASVYQSQGRLFEARGHYSRAVALWERTDDRRALAQSLNNLAALYCELRRYGQSELLYLRSIELREQALGRDHLDTGRAWNNLSVLYAAWGRLEEGEQAAAEALRILDRAGARRADLASIRVNLALMAIRRQRFGDAEEHARAAMKACAASESRTCPGNAQAPTVLAQALLGQKRIKEALAVAEPAAETTREIFGENHLLYAHSLDAYASALTYSGRRREADELLKKAGEIRSALRRRNRLDLTIDRSELERPRVK